MAKILKFSKDFLWGTGTSAYQVEGGNDKNDFWFWEKSRQRIEALKKEGKNPQDFISGRACEHYHRYEEDFDLAKGLNNNAHRFSIEWSRIEPEEGKFDEKEIEHYQKVIDALRKRGLEPFVTLHHFTNPIWFFKKGGWTKKESVKYFIRYIEKIVKNLKGVRFWITVNEPVLYAALKYFTGEYPPHKRNIILALRIMRNLVKAHRKAYEIISKISPSFQIGIAKNGIYYEPYKNSWLNKLLVITSDYIYNKYFLERIRDHQDFIGLNYYYHNRIKFNWRNPMSPIVQNENKEIDDRGSEIYPKGIYKVLLELKKYNKPIYITENGLADAKDSKRAKFIIEHLKWIHKAIESGLDVRGYFHWSLIDNFEWAEGFGPRFGLFEVDYKSLKRIPRPSARIYAEICRRNGIAVQN